MLQKRIDNQVRKEVLKAKEKYGTWENTADAIGVSVKSLHRYVNGEVNPTLYTYALICESVESRWCSDEEPSDHFIYVTHLSLVCYIKLCYYKIKYLY